MVEGGGLENRCAERHRGFESLSLRICFRRRDKLAAQLDSPHGRVLVCRPRSGNSSGKPPDEEEDIAMTTSRLTLVALLAIWLVPLHAGANRYDINLGRLINDNCDVDCAQQHFTSLMRELGMATAPVFLAPAEPWA